MARTAFTGARLFDGEAFRDGCHLVVEDGRVGAIVEGPPGPGVDLIRLDGGILSPGFVDAQVNGGGGVLFNDDPSPATIATIAAAHRRRGTTALLPTLITDDRVATTRAIAAAREAREANLPGIVGLHLEGPHLDPARKGAHLERYMRPVMADDVAAYAQAARALGTLLVTLAPRQATPEAVAALTAAGAIVSIGHADCTADAAEALFDAGARGVTHLYNAMSGLSHREPGLVGATLARGDVWAGIIADGHHVDPRALKIAFAAKPAPGRLFVVSDAMALVGSDRASFTLNGRTVRRDASGFCPRLTLDDGTLAGSDIDMAASVRFLVERVGLPLDDAMRRATADPADFLRIGDRYGRLRPGARADLVHLTVGLEPARIWMAEEL
jgi:N-acetylglucosamine-6-phosphate deacetylase